MVLGFDYIIDNNKNVQIIEINHRFNYAHPNNVSEKCFPCNNYTPPPITPTPKQNLPEGRCACFPSPSPCEDCTKDKPYCNEFDPDTPPYAGVCSSYFNNKNPKGNERSGNCRWNAACKSGKSIVCEALSQCHDVGTCDPDTGDTGTAVSPVSGWAGILGF